MLACEIADSEKIGAHVSVTFRPSSRTAGNRVGDRAQLADLPASRNRAESALTYLVPEQKRTPIQIKP